MKDIQLLKAKDGVIFIKYGNKFYINSKEVDTIIQDMYDKGEYEDITTN